MGSSRAGKISVISVITIAVLAFYKILTGSFGALDEFWNYNMSRGIALGYLPYRDFNMVQMPLFAFVNSIALLISKSLLAYRISCSVLLAVLVILLFREVRMRTNAGYALPVAIISLLFIDIISYNTLFFIFAIGVLMVFRLDSSKRNILLGILAALSALSRQTSGALLILCVLIIILSPLGGRATFKDRIRDALVYIAGVAIPCLIFLSYLLITGSYFEFWDYCLFSLLSFGSGNSIFLASAVPMLLITAAGLACDVYLIKNDSAKHLIHMILSLPVILIAVPIVDMHTVYSAIWFLLPIAQFICKRFGDKLRPRVSVLLSALMAPVVLLMGIGNLIGCTTVSGRPELQGILMDRELIDNCSYIADKNKEYESLGYDVTVFSYDSILFSMFEGRYDPPFDMFLTGNLGMHDPMEYVTAVCDDPDSVIMIPDNYDTEGWQNPEGVYDYITANCTPVDSYGRFVWYVPD